MEPALSLCYISAIQRTHLIKNVVWSATKESLKSAADA